MSCSCASALLRTMTLAPVNISIGFTLHVYFFIFQTSTFLVSFSTYSTIQNPSFVKLDPQLLAGHAEKRLRRYHAQLRYVSAYVLGSCRLESRIRYLDFFRMLLPDLLRVPLLYLLPRPVYRHRAVLVKLGSAVERYRSEEHTSEHQ